ncbi:MAG: ATP-binding protein [Lachnospiraceae bacterium]|nr:ATP-binding protein [Lachnospiraceae bacterium]
MSDRINPFTPNFGQTPRHIAGRDLMISDIFDMLEGNIGSPARTSIFIGARGSGKTALLTYFASECLSRGWISVSVSCVPGMQEDILQQAAIASENLIPKEKKTHITGVSLGNLFSVEWAEESVQKPNWRTGITRLLEYLSENETGLLITIDEVRPSLDEMIQVASVYQLLIRENRKVALLMAGLPSEVSMLINDRSVSFLRRASQYYLERIEDHDIETAFRLTVADSGKSVGTDALDKAVRAINGFPYMMQLVGYRAWQDSGDKEQIDSENMERGIELAEKDFESRVLKATVNELSRGDIAFLRAMLPDEGKSDITSIISRMKKSSGYVSRYRARLIERGVIEAVSRGVVAFALPGLKEYLRGRKHLFGGE